MEVEARLSTKAPLMAIHALLNALSRPTGQNMNPKFKSSYLSVWNEMIFLHRLFAIMAKKKIPINSIWHLNSVTGLFRISSNHPRSSRSPMNAVSRYVLLFLCLTFEKWLEKLQGLLDICTAVRFLHNLNIVHNDINPRNVLISKGYVTLLTWPFEPSLIRLHKGASSLRTSGWANGWRMIIVRTRFRMKRLLALVVLLLSLNLTSHRILPSSPM